ncbi:MAG: O-antigen ligase family protein [Terriglobia bacterium]|jgi:exopolysaccharide production protein ExoQ
MTHFAQPARLTYVSRITAGSRGLRWPLVLFLIVVFFVPDQDLFYSQKFAEGFIFDPVLTTKGITEGTPSREVALLALGMFGVITLFGRRHQASQGNGWLGGIIVLYLSWSFLSILWAEDVSLTFRRLIVLLMLCLGAVAASRHLWRENLVRFTFYSAGFYLVVGILAEIILGTFHPSLAGYRFSGTNHPNHQGWNCALLLLASVCASRYRARGRRTFQLCAGIALVFLVLTRSRTAFGSVILCLFVYCILVWARSRKLAAVFCVGTALTLLLFLFGDRTPPTLRGVALLGRDNPSSVEDLTGRLPLWQECLKYVAKRPLLGYGYGGFFTGRHVIEVSGTSPWGPAGAHSIYVDSLLDLGAIGPLALALIFFLGIKRSISHYREGSDPQFAFAAVLLLFCALDGVMESITSNLELPTFLCMVVLSRLAFRWLPQNVRRA